MHRSVHFAAVTTNLVEEAREHHGTSPVATAALGRLLTGGVMMGSMMKNDTDMLTIQIQCSGQIEGLTVTADSKGNVKGYVFNPDVMLPAKNGKLDVGGALGQGGHDDYQRHGTQGAIFRADNSADRRDRRGSYLLFRNI